MVSEDNQLTVVLLLTGRPPVTLIDEILAARRGDLCDVSPTDGLKYICVPALDLGGRPLLAYWLRSISESHRVNLARNVHIVVVGSVGSVVVVLLCGSVPLRLELVCLTNSEFDPARIPRLFCEHC
jgi:hypothetical protein